MTDKEIKEIEEALSRIHKANFEFLNRIKDLDIPPSSVIGIIAEAWSVGLAKADADADTNTDNV